jgi:hypothetical protein
MQILPLGQSWVSLGYCERHLIVDPAH